MGLCINIFGIPVIGDKACLDSYRKHRQAQNEINEAANVAINESNNDRKTENTATRNWSAAEQTAWRNLDGESPLQELFQGAGGAASGVIGSVGSVYSGVLGSLFGTGGGASTDLTPLLLIGGAVAVGVLALKSGGR